MTLLRSPVAGQRAAGRLTLTAASIIAAYLLFWLCSYVIFTQSLAASERTAEQYMAVVRQGNFAEAQAIYGGRPGVWQAPYWRQVTQEYGPINQVRLVSRQSRYIPFVAALEQQTYEVTCGHTKLSAYILTKPISFLSKRWEVQNIGVLTPKSMMVRGHVRPF